MSTLGNPVRVIENEPEPVMAPVFLPKPQRETVLVPVRR